MKLLLKKHLGLRGWQGMPRVLFDINKNTSIKKLDLEEFEILKKCDGNHDFESNDVIQNLLNKNIICLNEDCKNLEENQKYKFFNNRHFHMRNDFFDIVDELLKRNVKIAAINTNGSLITKEFIEKLKKRNIKPTFSVSFDGIGYHDWMRGVNGVEKDALNAIKIVSGK